MRLWSVHPSYLDHKGLVALWREGLLAQAVLSGETTGYKNHPQLERFREGGIEQYLAYVWHEADSRGYSFNNGKIRSHRPFPTMPVNDQQLHFEFMHLRLKLVTRDPAKYRMLTQVKVVRPHPSFHLVDGPIESWEKGDIGILE